MQNDTIGGQGQCHAQQIPVDRGRRTDILQSIEAVSIPQKLLLYGYDTTTALSVYGVLTGMAMPMIFFPNALTGSVAVLLLPTISENHAKGDREEGQIFCRERTEASGYRCMYR